MRNAGKEDEVMRFCSMAKLKLCGRVREGGSGKDEWMDEELSNKFCCLSNVFHITLFLIAVNASVDPWRPLTFQRD